MHAIDPHPIGEPFTGMTAATVAGDAHEPYYAAGDVLTFAAPEPPWTMLGVDAAVTLDDGRTVLGRLLRGSRPASYNVVSVAGPDLVARDTHVRCARPVRFIARTG